MFLVYVVAINKGSMRSILKQMITSKVSINNTVNLQIPIFSSFKNYNAGGGSALLTGALHYG